MAASRSDDEQAQVEPAQVLREYGPFPEANQAAGVTYDGTHVWLAGGEKLLALDPQSGRCTRTLDVPADAGTAFDGKHLYQLHGGSIHKLEPDTGRVVARIPAPADGQPSGLAWAEGALWLGQYQGRSILQLDPETGAVLRTIRSDRSSRE